MRKLFVIHLLFALLMLKTFAVSAQSQPPGTCKNASAQGEHQALIVLRSKSLRLAGPGAESRSLKLDGLFYETAEGRVMLPAQVTAGATRDGQLDGRAKMADGRVVRVFVKPDGKDFVLRLSAQPDAGIIRWGL